MLLPLYRSTARPGNSGLARLITISPVSVAATIKLFLVGLLSGVAAADLAAAVVAKMLVTGMTLPNFALTALVGWGFPVLRGPLLLLCHFSLPPR